MTASSTFIRPHALFPSLSHLIAQFDGLTHQVNGDLPHFIHYIVTWDVHGKKDKLGPRESSLTFDAAGAGISDGVSARFQVTDYPAHMDPKKKLSYNSARLSITVKENDWAETEFTFRQSREAFGAVTARIAVRGNGWEFPVFGYPHVLQIDGFKKPMSEFINSRFTKYPGKHLLDGHQGGGIFVALVMLQLATDWHNGVLTGLPHLEETSRLLAEQVSNMNWGD